MRGTSRFPLVLFLLAGLCLGALRLPATAAAFADTAAAWDRAGLRTTPPDPVQTLSVRDFGATGDGTTDDTAAFESAMAALASPGVLSVPAGTYRITRSLSLKSGLVLRGAGAASSKLVFNLAGASDPCLDFTTYNSRSWVALSRDAATGDTAITLADAASMAVGDWIEVEQQNDAAVMYTDPEWNQDWAQSVVGQFVRVTAVSGDAVSLDRPLRIGFATARSARARVYRLGQHVGIEDLAISREDPGTDGGETIHFKYAANCWVRRVESRYTVAAHVSIESSAAIEVTDSSFQYSHDYGDGGRGYGVTLGRHTSDCLVQNNVFSTLRHAMVVSQGANGNVFGYNFSTIRKCESTAWTPCDLSVHGHYPFRNLFEGNMVEEVDDTDYWGPAGPGNVFLRNVVAKEGLEIMDGSNGQAALGNLLLAGGPLSMAEGITDTVLSGNVVTDAASAVVTIPESDAPASLYLTATPSFFATATWPMLSGGTEANPAGRRYQAATTVSTATAANQAMIHIVSTLLAR
ncbi:MAG: glycosyl hydrolase family 28-related protein [Solidesulfovibrio sp. DCME]|uniref:glycosyl hydrolase family 28-related protein n=1 Tax=Solidesulfovibrio sp. DCME TaxID=3447380 RepID=UPI003D122012